jgi:hypothetical protein
MRARKGRCSGEPIHTTISRPRAAVAALIAFTALAITTVQPAVASPLGGPFSLAPALRRQGRSPTLASLRDFTLDPVA